MLSDGVAHDAIVRAVETAESGNGRRTSRERDKRGTRLPPDWAPSSDLVGYAVAQGLTVERADLEAEKFKNYWSAKSGTGAVKRDWDATWRNWILNVVERRHGGPSSRGAFGATSITGPRPTRTDAVVAGMGRLAHRRAANRYATGSGDRQMEADADPSGELDLDGGGT
jgi:hypothetical protein